MQQTLQAKRQQRHTWPAGFLKSKNLQKNRAMTPSGITKLQRASIGRSVKKLQCTYESCSCCRIFNYDMSESTHNKCALLFKHKGCLKCHHSYQDHHANNCPDGFLNGSNYKEVMEGILLGHQHQGNKSKMAKLIGAITLGSNAQAEDADDEDVPMTVGALMPSSALGSGLESEDKVRTSITSHHYQWLCNI